MKKILFAIAFVMMVSFGANAQSDGWFKSGGEDNYSGRTGTDIVLPSGHGLQDDQTGTAPLGSGLIILGALGAGYAVARRKRD